MPGDSHSFSENVTRPTFIQLLKQAGEDDWSRFYDRYAPLILAFARKRGCSDNVAEDVLQETIMALYRVLPDFNYDGNRGRFRSFLFRIAESKIVDAFRRTKRQVLVDKTAVLDHLDEQEAPAEQAWDRTWQQGLLADAVARARERVKPMTYKCFEKVFLEGKAVKDVAAELGIKPNLVSQHKHKVYTLIVQEAEALRKQYGE
jgi:RNA polymerase sigma-70 factor (ECF subfamily)